MTQFQSPLSQNGTDMSEARSMHRNRVIKGGNILFNKGYASFQCKIRNMNEKGALLELGETTGLPSKFDFRVSGEARIKPAELVWKTTKQIGIKFIN